jgi:uncharacterized cupin superfamily protein
MTAEVIRGGGPLAWTEVPRPEGDLNPPGEEVVTYRSEDGRFVTGFWRRVPEEGPMDLPYDEIAYIIEGEVEVTTEDGRVLALGPGDVLATPKGTKATWRALTPVRKFWAIYKPD